MPLDLGNVKAWKGSLATLCQPATNPKWGLAGAREASWEQRGKEKAVDYILTGGVAFLVGREFPTHIQEGGVDSFEKPSEQLGAHLGGEGQQEVSDPIEVICLSRADGRWTRANELLAL